MDQDGVEAHKLTEKERGLNPAILTEQASVKIKGYDFQRNFSSWTWRVVQCRQDGSFLPTRVANHGTGFDS